MGETLVTGKTTTTHSFRNKHLGRTHLCQGNDGICQTHLTGRASDMNCYRTIGRCEHQFVFQECIDKFSRFIQLHLLDALPHAMQTWALVAKYRIFTLLTGFPQSSFQFSRFPVSYIQHTLTFPNGSATKLVHVLREDNFITCLLQQRQHLVHQRLVYRRILRESHGLIDTAREINHLVGLSCLRLMQS